MEQVRGKNPSKKTSFIGRYLPSFGLETGSKPSVCMMSPVLSSEKENRHYAHDETG